MKVFHIHNTVEKHKRPMVCVAASHLDIATSTELQEKLATLFPLIDWSGYYIDGRTIRK